MCAALGGPFMNAHATRNVREGTMRKWLLLLTIALVFFGVVPVGRADDLPPYVLLQFRGHAQQLPLSCESRSAVDVAAFYGVHIPEVEFFQQLPKTDNPHTGFVGNVYGRWGLLPPNGYGVYAEPIAGLLRAHGLAADVRYGMGLAGLRAELAAGHPVILWATPRMAYQTVETYVASDGQTVSVVRYEHTVTAVGYTSSAIYVVDSGTGYRWAYSDRSLLAAWDKLGQMSVVVYGRTGETATSAPVAPPLATIRFTQPEAGDEVQVPLEIRGDVLMAGFDHYDVWYGVGTAPASWQWVSGPHLSQVQGTALTPVEFDGLAPGWYTLRVVVYGADGQQEGRVSCHVTPP